MSENVNDSQDTNDANDSNQDKGQNVDQNSADNNINDNAIDQASELLNLSKEELVTIIKDTRGEAKTKRLKLRELEQKISEIEKTANDAKQRDLEQKQEWEQLYNDLKSSTSDYADLKEFRSSYLTTCKNKIDKMLPTLTKAEEELFQMSSKSMTFDRQLDFINKLVESRAQNNHIDQSQSTARGSNDTEEDQDDQKRVPFAKTNSVMDNVMTILNKGRKKQK